MLAYRGERAWGRERVGAVRMSCRVKVLPVGVVATAITPSDKTSALGALIASPEPPANIHTALCDLVAMLCLPDVSPPHMRCILAKIGAQTGEHAFTRDLGLAGKGVVVRPRENWDTRAARVRMGISTGLFIVPAQAGGIVVHQWRGSAHCRLVGDIGK